MIKELLGGTRESSPSAAFRRDLGIHSDIITDGVVDLVEAGVVTGRRKTRHRDRIIASYAWGRGGSTTS